MNERLEGGAARDHLHLARLRPVTLLDSSPGEFGENRTKIVYAHDGGRRVVHTGRERLQSDVNNLADAERRVLLNRAVLYRALSVFPVLPEKLDYLLRLPAAAPIQSLGWSGCANRAVDTV